MSVTRDLVVVDCIGRGLGFQLPIFCELGVLRNATERAAVKPEQHVKSLSPAALKKVNRAPAKEAAQRHILPQLFQRRAESL